MPAVAVAPPATCEPSGVHTPSLLLELNPQLDRPSLSRPLSQHGRLQIPDILSPDSADTLYQCLSQEIDWGLMLGAGPGIGRSYVSAEQCRSFSPVQLRTLHDIAHAFKNQRGAHLHSVRPIALDAYDRATDPSLLARFVDFLNTEPFMGFARELTAAQDIRCVGAQATCFWPGHFFGFHTDAEDDDQQRATCVSNLTLQWSCDWSGLLQFKDKDHDIVDVFTPEYSSLSVFGYSQDHAVSVVTSACQAPRYAIAAALMAK